MSRQEVWEKPYAASRREISDKKKKRRRAKVKALAKKKQSGRIGLVQEKDSSLSDEQAKCRLKKTYKNKTQAWNRVVRSSAGLRPYRCKHCHLWHLTSLKRVRKL